MRVRVKAGSESKREEGVVEKNTRTDRLVLMF